MAMTLTEVDMARMGRILRDLIARSESDGCVVCDSGGYVLIQQGQAASDPLLLSALGAGVFAASRELAKILGEDEFSAVFHQGEKRSIFIRAVTSDVLLVIIFSNTANVGLVRLYASPAASALRAAFQDVAARDHRVDHPEHAFVLSRGDLFDLKRPGGA